MRENIFWVVGITGLIYFTLTLCAKGSDEKEFGEVLGRINFLEGVLTSPVRRFETPSAVCFTFNKNISCVPNK